MAEIDWQRAGGDLFKFAQYWRGGTPKQNLKYFLKMRKALKRNIWK